MVGPLRPQFVLFGSSIVQMSFNVGGWGAILADLYARKADVVLRGYAGWNTRMGLEVLDKVFPKDEPVQPSLVILYFGGNDSTSPHPNGPCYHVPLPEFVENTKKMITHIKSLSDEMRIVCLSCPPVNEARILEFYGVRDAFNEQARTNEGCRIYSEKIIELCKEMDVEAIDLWSAIQERDDWANSCFVDGIHFSAEGSTTVVKEILKVLKRVDWEPSLYWLKMSPEFPEDSPHVGPDGKSTCNMSGQILYWQRQWLDI